MKLLRLTVAVGILPIVGCSSSSDINPGAWSCASLIAPVIESSKGRSLEILEISNPRERLNLPNHEITCQGDAEWNEGSGSIEYGAHVSEGGNIVVSYRQL
jgi:hypothetical protein